MITILNLILRLFRRRVTCELATLTTHSSCAYIPVSSYMCLTDSSGDTRRFRVTSVRGNVVSLRRWSWEKRPQ